MPTLTIGDKSVTVDDSFLKLSPEQQNAAVSDIAKSIGVTGGAPAAAEPEADPLTANQVVRATATGVPVVGGLLNQANAATNAALAPIINPLFEEKDQLKGKTFSERRKESLRQQTEMDKRFEEQRPILDTALNITGGVAGTIPAMLAAPAAFGLTGTLPQMVARGAASNAALGGVDAVTRGQDPLAPAAIGGVLGGTLPLAGRAVGKLAQGVREFRNPTPPVPQNIESVSGVDIPLSTGQATSNPVVQAEEEIMRRGGRGGSAEAIARQADEEARAAVEQASGNIAASLDPAAASARTAPQAAAEVVQSELGAQAAARAAAEQQQALRVVSEGESLARGLSGGAAPVSAFDAAEMAGAAVTRARDAKVAATREAYKARDAVEGTFDPSVPRGMAEDIRTRLNTGENPIWVDPTNESTANKALKLIDETIGKGLFANEAAPKLPAEAVAKRASAGKLADDLTAQGIPADKARASAARAEGIGIEEVGQVENVPTVDLRTMDEARKRLVTMFGDAKSKAIASGDKSDMRAMGKILEEFDNSISDALASGKFSGDAALAKQLQDAARRSHAEYRQTFSSRGPGDEIGRAVEKILGRYSDTAATPGEIANMAYGPASNPGSGNTEKIALRMRDILGENSADWGQYKQGLFTHIAQAATGDAPLAPAKAAGRIDKFLNGQTSRFANKIFSPEERRQMANYAKSLRAAEPRTEPLNEVEKAVARIAGTDGHLPASPVEVADMLYGRAGKGDKGLSVRMALRLKSDLTPESWTAVRQGMWEKLTVKGEGLEPFGTQALSTRLHDFLNENGKPLARVLFTKAEREEMAKLASVYKRMTPLKGTTNPSGTAPMLAKIASKASDNVLALIGLGTGGVPGAIAGHAIQRGGEAFKDARAAKEATRLFFGPQARRPAGHSRVPQLIGTPAIQSSNR